MPVPSLSMKKPEPDPLGAPCSSNVYIMNVAISALAKTDLASFVHDTNNNPVIKKQTNAHTVSFVFSITLLTINHRIMCNSN